MLYAKGTTTCASMCARVIHYTTVVFQIFLNFSGIWHDPSDAGVRMPRVPVAGEPRRVNDMRAGCVGAARRSRRICQR